MPRNLSRKSGKSCALPTGATPESEMVFLRHRRWLWPSFKSLRRISMRHGRRWADCHTVTPLCPERIRWQAVSHHKFGRSRSRIRRNRCDRPCRFLVALRRAAEQGGLRAAGPVGRRVSESARHQGRAAQISRFTPRKNEESPIFGRFVTVLIDCLAEGRFV